MRQNQNGLGPRFSRARHVAWTGSSTDGSPRGTCFVTSGVLTPRREKDTFAGKMRVPQSVSECSFLRGALPRARSVREPGKEE